jgi:uncharacterized protein YodC (DUF2158 family)
MSEGVTMKFKVGDKVKVYMGGFWEDAVVVDRPEDGSYPPKKAGSVFVEVEIFKAIYRYNREWVRKVS